ncbi:MAG: arylsulfatase B [Akkermansiaceae bacterium]|jgi:arylsulfatase A-like enzyme
MIKKFLGFLPAPLIRAAKPLCFAFSISSLAFSADKPNIVIVITDDQGYGDLACHGNPVIKTPHLDKLHSESTVLTDYHVAPTCSPTRAALLTGHWTNRTGVWHTIQGRSMIRENEVTLGQHFAKDYATAMFGKWHLGDNYPYRPEDRGFEEVYRHGGGGVGQTPDLWDNSYFDGSYFHNGKIVPAKGFCTDVFFQKAHDFIKTKAATKEPFLAYISTNAPHGPLHCPQKYMDMYQDQKPNLAAFFGMISNIDENVGATRKLLTDLGIADNTLFIYTTDNGTAAGAKVFNAGMKGNKGSPYDGGHRVPMFIHWPDKGLNKHVKFDTLCHAVDIVPTLLQACKVENTADVKFDGWPLGRIFNPKIEYEKVDRFLITDSQRVVDPIKWRQSSVMSQQFRLINGKELYDIKADPGQKKDIAKANPEQVAKMRDFYDKWWADISPSFSQTTEIYLGHPNDPVSTLTAHDWLNTGPPWNQGHIRRGDAYDQKKAATQKKHNGHWAVKVISDGTYEITARRWPTEANHPITAGLPAGKGVPGSSKAFRENIGQAFPITAATLRIDGKELETKPVGAKDTHITFTTDLKKGSHKLAPVFLHEKGEVGAYYCIVKKK